MENGIRDNIGEGILDSQVGVSGTSEISGEDTLGIGAAPDVSSGEISYTATSKEVTQTKAEAEDLGKEMALEMYIKQCIEENIMCFNPITTKKNFPAAYNSCVDYMARKANIPTLEEDTVFGVFLYSPRTILYEFFDEKGIFVNVIGGGDKWSNNVENKYDGIVMTYPKRILAEIAGFTAAFKILNENLS